MTTYTWGISNQHSRQNTGRLVCEEGTLHILLHLYYIFITDVNYFLPVRKRRMHSVHWLTHNSGEIIMKVKEKLTIIFQTV